MSKLVEHARRELTLLGEFDESPDYAESLVKAVEAFASVGHSGASAMIGREVLYRLLSFENLTPITDNPDEWHFHGEDVWGEPGGIWQNVRNSALFSNDGGKHYWHVDDRDRVLTPAVPHDTKDAD